VNYPFQVETTMPKTMLWGPAGTSPFLGRVLFRDGANSFGVWDTGFDDRQGTMEAWVFCGRPVSNYCKGPGRCLRFGRRTRCQVTACGLTPMLGRGLSLRTTRRGPMA